MHRIATNEEIQKDTYDFVEECPNCGHVTHVIIDPNDKRYEMTCPECGEKLMLCNQCAWDFGMGTCNCSMCARGIGPEKQGHEYVC